MRIMIINSKLFFLDPEYCDTPIGYLSRRKWVALESYMRLAGIKPATQEEYGALWVNPKKWSWNHFNDASLTSESPVFADVSAEHAAVIREICEMGVAAEKAGKIESWTHKYVWGWFLGRLLP